MINLTGSIRNLNYVAVSGGVDGMALLSFVHRCYPDISVAHFNHGTEHGKEAQQFVTDYCETHKIALEIGQCQTQRDPKDSWEDYWRKERYRFLHNLEGSVATAHHLDDVAETYLFGSFHGRAKLIPYRNGNVVRPLLLTPKSELIDWCERKRVPYIQDPSNHNHRFARNRIRHEIMPQVKLINPGFLTVISKLLKKSLEDAKEVCPST